jgi:anti-sigma regulatory factor (Ser/Thr protein kinase)
VTPVKKAAEVSTLRLSLPRSPGSPARARRHVGAFVAEHGVADTDTLLLVVSELVTNAVIHGAEPIEVQVSWHGDRVRIEVTDRDPDAAAVAARGPRPDRPGGRGLRIVETLTRRWGVVPAVDGKTVWVELDLGAGAGGGSDSRG